MDVENWLPSAGADDSFSVVDSEFADVEDLAFALESECYEDGDEECSGEDCRAVLASRAQMLQRLVASEHRRRFVRGGMHRDAPAQKPQPQRQRVVSLEEVIELTSLADEAFYERLQRERVIAHVRAETGLGKTRKLCGKIATTCGFRVMQVELDANVAKEAMAVQAEAYGLPVGHYRWPKARQAFLSVLTYEDVVGYACSRTRDNFFSTFEVFVFDESHVPHAEVQAAIQLFINYAPASASLLLLSATVSGADATVASKVGDAQVEPVTLSLAQAMAAGRLTHEWIRDRTLVLAPTDAQVGQVRAFCEEAGYLVDALDTASLTHDLERVRRFLAPTSSGTPRVVVAHAEYGTSYNFAVSQVVTSGTVGVFEVDQETHNLVEEEVYLQPAELVQQRGRVGRGLATGGGTVVLTPDEAPVKLMRRSEAASYYLMLVAGAVIPRLAGMDVVAKWFPAGVSRDTARVVLQVSSRYRLPALLVARYLAADGRIARRFHSALRVFAQADASLPVSAEEWPLRYDTWVREELGGYDGEDEAEWKRGATLDVRVPFSSPPSLRVVMHAISAMADGLIEVPAWRYPAEDEESGDELDPVVQGLPKLRVGHLRPVSVPAVGQRGAVTVRSEPWAYAVDPSKQYVREKRQGMSWMQTDRGAEAAELLRRRFLGEFDDMGVSAMEPKPNAMSVEPVVVPLEQVAGTPVVARSPGGTGVVTIAARVYAGMAMGDKMQPRDFVKLMQVLNDVDGATRFAGTTVYDGWSPAWASMWFTMGSAECVNAAKVAGAGSTMLKLNGALYQRFRAEALQHLAKSKLYREPLRRWFKKSVSINRLASAVRKGTVPIAQSDRFVDQWLRMLDMHDAVLQNFEKCGLFDPGLRALTQDRLPIDSRSRGRGLVVAPDYGRVGGTGKAKSVW